MSIHTQLRTARRSNQTGFTIIELLVAVLIIIALLSIIGATYTGISKRERNEERKKDIEALHNSFESYYAKYNKYPLLSEINDTAWRTKNIKNLKNLKEDNLRDPNGKSDTLVAAKTADAYSYAVTAADGKSCDNNKTQCVRYTLTTIYEGGTEFTKSSLN